MVEADDSRTREQLLVEIEQLKRQVIDLQQPKDKPPKHGVAYFDERLQEEVARSTRYNYEFSVLMLQLDNLQTYSSRFNGEAVDEVLGMLKTIIRDSARKTDICCQFEPGRYAMILPYTNAPGVKVVAERLRQTVERVFNFKSLSVKVSLTLSLGAASYPRDAVSCEHLVELVNAAFVAAQSKGGNCMVTAEHNVNAAQLAVSAGQVITHDDLMTQAIDDEVIRCSRYRQKFALLMLAFSKCGEDGSNGLKRVRERLRILIKTAIRSLDRCYSMGESRFVILLPSTDSEGARIVAEKLQQTIKENPVILPDNSTMEIMLNIGGAAFPFDEVSREALLKRAGAALDESIKKGSNNFIMASAMAQSKSKKSWGVQDWVTSLKEAGPDAIYNMVASLDLMEQYPRPHSQAVARYAMAIGQGMGFSSNALRQLRTIALFHDMGMMCLPAEIITKPGSLTAKERQAIYRHPKLGADILEQFHQFAFCVRPVLAHHERWDGRGYPYGLGGDSIQVEARIIAVAEALDDMITPRPYKQRMLMQQAIEELKKNAGTQFDPAMVQALIKSAYQMQARAAVH